MKRSLPRTLLDRAERRVFTWRMSRRCPGRGFEVFPDDVVVVSYPRSGNTWTRFLIANLTRPDEPATFVGIEQHIPDIYRATRAHLAAIPRPRVIKSHEYFDPRYRKVIYIVRDPRDVAVSYYHYQRKTHVLADDSSIDSFITSFLTGRQSPYGTWAENVTSWLGTRGDSADMLLVRYEDMIAQPVEALQRIAGFLDLRRTREQLEAAVARSSATEMRRIEQKDQAWSVTQKSRKDIPFVRTATSGTWKDQLSASAVERIEVAWGPLMARLGYEPSSEPGRRSLVAGKRG